MISLFIFVLVLTSGAAENLTATWSNLLRPLAEAASFTISRGESDTPPTDVQDNRHQIYLPLVRASQEESLTISAATGSTALDPLTYISLSVSGSVGGVGSSKSDILVYDANTAS